MAELTVEGATLEPEFNSDVYEYTINLTDPNTKELNITAVPNITGASIEIAGETDLKVGENIITILVRGENEEDITTYQIKAIVPEAGLFNSDMLKYIALGVAVLFILFIIILVIRRNRKNKQEIETYFGGYNLENDVAGKKDDLQTPLGMDLSEDEKPKSLRKNAKSNSDIPETNNFNSDNKEIDKQDIISKNFGNIENIDDDYDDRPRRRGKHF